MRNLVQILSASTLGGGELLAINLAQSCKTSFKSSVWVGESGCSSDYAENAGVDTSIFPIISQKRSGFNRILNALKFRKTLLDSRVDVIHFHSPFVYKQLSPFIPRKITTLVHVHSEYEIPALQWCLRRFPTRLIFCANFLLDQINLSKSPLVDYACRMISLPNAIRVEDFFHRTTDFSLNISHVRLLMLANLSPLKGQETAIRALSELRKRKLNAVLSLAGEDRSRSKYLEKLVELATELGVDEFVHFLGYRDDVSTLLSQTDFLLLPSKKEGLPLCLLEAMASGVLVLAAPTAGVPDIIQNGINGFLLPADDFLSYSNCIYDIVKNPPEYRSITTTALEYVLSKHDWVEYVSRYCSLVKESLHTRGID
jgi:glycosyltransferase involved in cell wall biosynthesis